MPGIVAVLSLWCLPLHGQETGSVTGTIVSSATGQPIGGAQVSLPGTGRGTVAGANGRYLVLNVPTGTHTVEVQVLGYGAESAEVTIRADESTVRDFELTEQAISLDEVVVTGTAGAARRREIGNTVASVDAGRLQEVSPSSNVSDMLQAQVAGLQQFTTEGQVGAGTQLRLRGNNSITQGNSPLIYVDGVRLVDAVPPDEGAQQQVSALDLLNPDDIERIEVIKGAAATTLYGTEANSGVIQIFTKRGGGEQSVWAFESKAGARFASGNGLGPVIGDHENWQSLKPWLRTGGQYDFSGSVRGSTQGMGYYFSGAYQYGEGVFPTQDMTRSSFRANLAFEPLNGVNVNVNTNYTHQYTNWVQSGDNVYGVVLNLLRSPRNYTSGDDQQVFDQRTNSIDDHFTGGVTATFSPWPSVTNRFTAGIDWRDGTNGWTVPKGNVLLEAGRRDVNRFRHVTLSLDYVGSWSSEFATDFGSEFSWGFQVFDDRDQRVFGTTESFSGPGLDQTLSSGALRNSNEEVLDVVNAGFFLQEQVGFQDRLFLTGGLRVDGNSAFGSDFGLQPYPKISASYILSDHGFWPDWSEQLKVRAALGESGKAPGVFDAVRTYSPTSGLEGEAGVTPNNLGDPDLGPERTREVEFGFEGSAFDGRLSTDLTFYDATTRDALVPVQFPPSEGFASPQLSNVGEIRNRGLELTIDGTPVRSRNFSWDVGMQFSYNESEALNLRGEQLQIGFQSWRQWAIEGYPVPGYFDIQVTNPDEIADPVYSDDVQFLGKVYPDKNYQFNTTFNLFRSFTLYAVGEASTGHSLMNAVGRQNQVRGLWPQCAELEQNPDQMTALWRARCVDMEWASWIFPADFFKLRTVSLSYQLPEGLVPGASSALLRVTGRNLWKSTDYPGLDPEITRGDRFLERREYYHLPPSQSVTAALRLIF